MNQNDVARRLSSAWHEKTLSRNISDIRGRIMENGYFPESMTGAYPGMFPRTVGALARLFTLTGELDTLEHCVEYVFQSMEDAMLDRVPHVIGPQTADGRIPMLDATDQIDGQAHIILAYALLSLARASSDYEDTRWEHAARLMDRSVQSPYLSRNTNWRIHPGLVLNINLEHSRERNYWFAYDFLSQSFVAAALEAMIALAKRRGNADAADRWQDALDFLNKHIKTDMVRELDGKPAYLEMLLPCGRAPVAWEGTGWLNLAPVPSGWKGADPDIFRHTIRAWHKRADIKWPGPVIAACDWSPDSCPPETYGKMLGWDMVFCMEAGDYDRVCSTLDFLEQVNTGDLYAEVFTWVPDEKQWKLRDAGNGEQAAWLCWSLMRVRELAGLSVLRVSC